MMKLAPSPWRTISDRVLAPLFEGGREPTKRELRDAYPFGERKYWPYKIWLEEVHWFERGCPPKSRRKDARQNEPLPGQKALLEVVDVAQ